MLTSLKLKMYQKLNDPTFLFKAQYALNPITVLGFILLAPVMLVGWLLNILFAPTKWLFQYLPLPDSSDSRPNANWLGTWVASSAAHDLMTQEWDQYDRDHNPIFSHEITNI